jgi:putative glycerol-1-phosphate prenyltransferase
MKIYDQIKNIIKLRGAAYFILIDPDKLALNKIKSFVEYCVSAGVDGFLIGGSLMVHGDLDSTIKEVKNYCDLPVIVFPGSVNQVSKYADAILYISLISGRNAEHLIGQHVQAAPSIKKYNIEPISTGYMLIESGKITTAEYISESKPIPRNKPEIAVATALAGEYLGMNLIYLEGGSGADNSVPTEMIKKVSENVSIPIIVGGGIKSPTEAKEKIDAGADIIVTGNYFENDNNWKKISEFSNAIHSRYIEV